MSVICFSLSGEAEVRGYDGSGSFARQGEMKLPGETEMAAAYERDAHDLEVAAYTGDNYGLLGRDVPQIATAAGKLGLNNVTIQPAS